MQGDQNNDLAFSNNTAGIGIDQQIDAPVVGRHAHPEDGTALRPGVKHPSAPAGHRHGAIDAVVPVLKLAAIAAIEALHVRLALPRRAIIVLPVSIPLPGLLAILIAALTIAAAETALVAVLPGGGQPHHGLVRTAAQNRRFRRRGSRNGQGRPKRGNDQRKTKKGPNLFHDIVYRHADLNLI
jgi:hypothetical protein